MKKSLLILTFCSLFTLDGWSQTPKYGTYYEQKATLFEQLPVKRSDIVFLGNSITDGCEWGELFANSHIKNRGISGDVTMGVYDRLDAILIGQPKKIFLMIGVNDLSQNKTPEEVLANIKLIVEKIKLDSPKTKLYLQSVLPISEDFTRFPKVHGKTADLQAVNKGLEKLATAANATYIDLFPHFTEQGGTKLARTYTNDGLHLTAPGYILWRDLIKKYL